MENLIFEILKMAGFIVVLFLCCLWLVKDKRHIQIDPSAGAVGINLRPYAGGNLLCDILINIYVNRGQLRLQGYRIHRRHTGFRVKRGNPLNRARIIKVPLFR